MASWETDKGVGNMAETFVSYTGLTKQLDQVEE
ncbi:MAG: hypothetical protein JWP10_1687, partial [Nocardioidaceae bacterium]|nr:hypothetical protein [Nocardioidaceae bacterium]